MTAGNPLHDAPVCTHEVYKPHKEPHKVFDISTRKRIKGRSVQFYQNIERAAAVIIDYVSSSHVTTD